MENKTTNAPTVLTDKVKELKLIARKALRMELISPILAEIYRLEKEISQIKEIIAKEEKTIAIANYKITRLTRLDAEHPDFDNLKKRQEETMEDANKAIEHLNKDIEGLNKLIQDKKDAIAKVETGETLVDADRLNDMVNKLILQSAKDTATTPF